MAICSPASKLLIWTSEASRARTHELAGEAARGRGKESDHYKLSFLFPTCLFGVSSRVTLARLLFTISHKWRACSQASNLLVASCTLCSCKKTNVFWAYKEKERVKQKSKGRSSNLDRKSMVSVVWLFDNAHIKFVTLKLALPTRK